jgi:3-deoxy-manno-octulosonate cytidylyltransferase (CMP-KDO synthetase)
MAAVVVAVIPARLNSRRFPNKVIYLYRDKPLLFYVYNEVRKAKKIDRIVVATDSKQVQKAVAAFGGEAVLTSTRHRTGSDRVAEVMQKLGGDIVINVQADNFGLKAPVLDRTIDRLTSDGSIEFATLARRLDMDDELLDPHVVKVVVAGDGAALWFSRLPIPYLQKADKKISVKQFPFLAHIGVYFFRSRGLAKFSRWKRSPLEKAESLEQLRILENGGKMTVFKTSMRPVSVDTPKDLKKLKRVYG